MQPKNLIALLFSTLLSFSAWAGSDTIPIPSSWVYGTAITFDTKWESASESCNSITSWAGYYYQGQITTFWNLVQNGSITSSQIVQGKDTFTPVTKVVNKKLMHKK